MYIECVPIKLSSISLLLAKEIVGTES